MTFYCPSSECLIDGEAIVCDGSEWCPYPAWSAAASAAATAAAPNSASATTAASRQRMRFRELLEETRPEFTRPRPMHSHHAGGRNPTPGRPPIVQVDCLLCRSKVLSAQRDLPPSHRFSGRDSEPCASYIRYRATFCGMGDQWKILIPSNHGMRLSLKK